MSVEKTLKKWSHLSEETISNQLHKTYIENMNLYTITSTSYLITSLFSDRIQVNIACFWYIFVQKVSTWLKLIQNELSNNKERERENLILSKMIALISRMKIYDRIKEKSAFFRWLWCSGTGWKIVFGSKSCNFWVMNLIKNIFGSLNRCTILEILHWKKYFC